MVGKRHGTQATTSSENANSIPARERCAGLVSVLLTKLGIGPQQERLQPWADRDAVDLSDVGQSPAVLRSAKSAACFARFRSITLLRRLPRSPKPLDSSEVFLVFGSLPRDGWSTAVSSRLGSAKHRHPSWIDGLRTFCRQVGPTQSVLITRGQYVYPFLHRFAVLCRMPISILFQATPGKLFSVFEKFPAWSPNIPNPTLIVRIVTQSKYYLPPDELVASHCAEVRAISVRRDGNIARMLQARLAAPRSSIATRILILQDTETKPEPHIEDLLKRGAIAWHLWSEPSVSRTAAAPVSTVVSSSAQIIALRDFDDREFVAHFTRGVDRPWRDQSLDTALDPYLMGRPPDRGPLNVLSQILEQNTLAATNRLTRDATRVVCFTNIPLRKFRRTRVFRPHIARWDFEPFGIAVRRTAFQAAGGRPVLYGDEGFWKRLDPGDRPFFQIARGRKVQWQREEEWRIVGDLNLQAFAQGQVVAFVPSREDALRLAPLCHWPIVVLGIRNPSAAKTQRRRHV